MKLTSSIPALVAILGIALASAPVTTQAQTTTPAATTAAPAPTATPSKTKKATPTKYEGNVTAIDTTANTITVASTAKVLTLAIAPTTKFKKDKKEATLADFAVGDKVTGSYTKDATGAMTAYSVHKTTAKKAAKTAAASATPAAAPAPAAPAAQ